MAPGRMSLCVELSSGLGNVHGDSVGEDKEILKSRYFHSRMVLSSDAEAN